jgi:hypothetical protein
LTYVDQGFEPNAIARYRARFEAICDRIAAARLSGIFFLSSLAKERGATASGSVVAVAALAAFGALVRRDWISEAGVTSRGYVSTREFLQCAAQGGVAYPRRRPRAGAPGQFWAYF